MLYCREEPSSGEQIVLKKATECLYTNMELKVL